MPRLAYTDDIDLCFGNAVREFNDFVASPLACNFVRERFHLFGQDRIGINRQTQTMATAFLPHGAAVRGFRAGASLSIRAVGLDFAVAGQAAFSP